MQRSGTCLLFIPSKEDNIMLNCRLCAHYKIEKLQAVALQHVYIPCLDYPFYTVLAIGPVGTHPVSHFVAHQPSVSPVGHCSGWRISITEINHSIAFADVAAAIKKRRDYFSYATVGVFTNSY